MQLTEGIRIAVKVMDDDIDADDFVKPILHKVLKPIPAKSKRESTWISSSIVHGNKE